MADKRISQLVERTDIANNDVVPIVASGATTTNKATISSIQEFMQENLDLGVTSVGITLGTTGTDVSVSGSPITTSGNITINLPTASATNRGLLSSADWTTFNNKQAAGNYVTLDTAQTITAQKVFSTSGSSDTMIISHGSGSGFALDVIKAGNGEAIRVTKTSGSGNAMSITGGNFSAQAATFSGVVTTTPDAVINGVNVGKGGGSVSTNTRIGFGSLGSNTSGSENTSVGYLSLQNNTVGGSNTVLGYGSMTANTSGTQNIAIGNTTFVSNTTGNTNIAIGGQAGRYTSSAAANTNSSNSIFIGYDTRASADSQANQIVIGHNAIGNGSNTVTLGNDSITNTYLKGMVNAPNSVSILKKSDGFGGFTSNYLFLERGTSTTTSGVDGISLLSKPTGRALNVRYDIGGVTYGAELNADLLDNSRTYQFPNASGTFALTSNLSAYLPLAGGTLTGALNGTSAIFTGSITSYDTLVSRTLTNTTPSLLLSRNNADNGFGVIRVLDGGTISFENGPTGATQTSRLTLDGTTGAATLTGALNGTTASFTGASTLLTLSSGAGTKAVFETTRSFSVNRNFQIAVDEFAESAFTITPSTALGGSTYTTPIFTLAAAGAATFSSSVTSSLGSSGANFNSNAATTGSVNAYRVSHSNGIGSFGLEANAGGDLMIGGLANATLLQSVSNTPLQLGTNQTARLTILSNGNVGIGTASPQAKLHVNNGTNLNVGFNTTTIDSVTTSRISSFNDAVSATVGLALNGTPLVFQTEANERMRITSGGDVLVGFTGGTFNDPVFNNVNGISLRGNTSGNSIIVNSNTGIPMVIGRNDSTGTVVAFNFNGSTTVGSIVITAATTSYNVTSDYRLKEDLQEIKGLEKVLALKVYDYKWKAEESRMDGVLAHELAEVLPYAVTGEKDAVDEEGNDKMQGVDYSKIVPILIKAIQEQQEQINQLKNQIK